MENIGIEFYNNIFENPENIIDTLNKLEWEDPLIINNNRSNSVMYINQYGSNKDFFDLVKNSINQNVQDYCKKYSLPELSFEIIEGLRYQPNQQFFSHYDNGAKHVVQRVVSCVIYLNDDYEGGEIEFHNFETKIKPVKNSMILFPSNYPYAHSAHIVKSGTRYALNIFMEYK